MLIMQTRRHFLTALSLAGAGGLLREPQASAAEEPLETTTLRMMRTGGICAAPQYVAEEFLRAEGFTDIRFVAGTSAEVNEAVARNTVDFNMHYASEFVSAIDGGAPITILAGVHVGCFELFVQDGIHAVTELKGKNVAIPVLNSSPHLFTAIIVRASRPRSCQGYSLGRELLAKTDRAVRGRESRRLSRLSAGGTGGARPPARSCSRQQRGRYALVAVFLLHVGRQPRLRPGISGGNQARAARDPQGRRSVHQRPGGGRETVGRGPLHAGA